MRQGVGPSAHGEEPPPHLHGTARAPHLGLDLPAGDRPRWRHFQGTRLDSLNCAE